MTGLLCLDLGTSSAKAALIDPGGRIITAGSAPYPTRTTPDGGAEQDPEDWVRAARTAIAQAAPDPSAVDALVLTGQMQDLVLEGEDGPAHPAVLYSDLRAAEEAHRIRADLAAEGHDWEQITGNLQDASSCAAMALRLARTRPDALTSTRAIVFGPVGHLAHVLGAGAWCDETTAAATGLLDARTREWSLPVARAAGIDPALLPRLTHSIGETVGRTDGRAREILGLPSGLPLVLAPGDAGAAAIGVSGQAAGSDHASLGTSGWLASIRPAHEVTGADGTTHHLALGGGTTLRISAVLAAGAAAAWARRTYLGGVDAQGADRLLEERERAVGRGPTGLLALPSLGGERYPVREESLRAAVHGIGHATTPVDLYAGMLEGVALGLSHALPAGSTGQVLPVVGGGAASAPWRRILADVTGRPVLALGDADATLHGAAIAGATALGADGPAPLAERPGILEDPNPQATAAFAALRPAHRELYETTRRLGVLIRR